jgi:serine/threonine-protein kinase
MQPQAPLIVGRYAIYDRIAAGGMATVHLGRLVGERGFSRTVAIKRLHAHYAMDPDFVAMFLDEARLAARIRHPNVVQTLDVVVDDGEVFLVMDYVEGESFAHVVRILHARGESMPPACASALLAPVLHGLHAAHEAKNDHGEPLGLVHRDVTPQNILVGVDGVPRVLDFGVAKALGQSHSTRDGQLKGKIAYMAPEQIEGRQIDRRTDVFAASVVLWEALAGRRLFHGDGEAQIMRLVLTEPILPPSSSANGIPPALDAVVMCGLSRDPNGRFATTEQMADALEDAVAPMPSRKLAAWVQMLLGDKLAARAKLVREIESASTTGNAGYSKRSPLAATVGPSMDELDVTIAVEPVEGALPQASSQASSISVEAPRVASVPPKRARVMPLMIAGAVMLCIGLVTLGAALRKMRDSAAATEEGTSKPAVTAAAATAPAQPVAAAAPPPATPVTTPDAAASAAATTAAATAIPTAIATPTPAATATPTATPTPAATATATPTASPVVASRPTPAPRPTPVPARPTPAAAPAAAPPSKLYSRF